MSGALIDLVAVGVQDTYIKGDPQVSFFRNVYKRHTNFAFKPVRLDYTGTFGAGNQVSLKIPSKGDLLSYIWIENLNISDLDDSACLLQPNVTPTSFKLYIGGQLIDTQDALFKSLVWPNAGYADSTSKAAKAADWGSQPSDTDRQWYPLHFFFCDNNMLCLPLVALQYQEVELRIECSQGISLSGTPKIYANYVVLDTDERQYFVDKDHELLIPQVQRLQVDVVPETPSEIAVDLSYFNHPVQAIHLASTSNIGDTSISGAQRLTFSDASLFIDGTPLMENVSNVYTHDVVPYHHAKNIVSTLNSRNPLYTFPFTLNASWNQPAGSLNFSRLDNATLRLKNAESDNESAPVYVYGVNWNILRIKKGMAGIAFGN